MLTNIPGKVMKTTITPDISDHDCPLVVLYMQLIKRKQPPRHVPICKKANWAEFEQDLYKANDKINEQPPDTPVNTL